MYALGIHFSNDKCINDKLNFEKKLEDLQKILNSWKRRKLTLLGRINIVKTLGLSKLIYNASVLPLPEEFAKQVDKITFDFVWEGKPHKIKKATLIGEKSDGGLKMIEFDSINKALKASWVRRFNNDADSPWKIIPNFTTRESGGFQFLLSCNYKTKELQANDIPIFYLKVLNYWEQIKKIKSEQIQKDVDVRESIIWNNTDFKVEGTPIFYQSWYNSGITKVKHLLHHNSNKLLSFEEFTTQFKIKTSFLTYYGLLRAVKSRWKTTTLNTQMQTTNASWLDTKENLSNAALHKIIVKSKFQPPNTENRIIGYGIDQSEVSVIYNWPFSVTKNVKLAMFQFKINHNILYTKDKLKKANLVSDDSCYLCKNERHTIVHMFVKCPLVVSFWKNFHLWWLQNTMENIHLSEVTLLYGPIHPLKYQQVLSVALLIAKYFIYKCSLTEESLTFQVFKLQFHDNTMVERYIAVRNKTKNIFNEKWKPFISNNFIPATD